MRHCFAHCRTAEVQSCTHLPAALLCITSVIQQLSTSLLRNYATIFDVQLAGKKQRQRSVFTGGNQGNRSGQGGNRLSCLRNTSTRLPATKSGLQDLRRECCQVVQDNYSSCIIQRGLPEGHSNETNGSCTQLKWPKRWGIFMECRTENLWHLYLIWQAIKCASSAANFTYFAPTQSSNIC